MGAGDAEAQQGVIQSHLDTWTWQVTSFLPESLPTYLLLPAAHPSAVEPESCPRQPPAVGPSVK